MKKLFDLSGKVALVTGARRGMGRAEALALAVQGAKVAVTDISEEECQAVADEIVAAGGTALAYRMDVTNSADIDRVITDVVSRFGSLDILVNNAGVYRPKPALELTEDEWNQTIRINLTGQFLCAQRAAREMAKNRYGRIINIASIASGQVGVGVMGAAHYAASKGGIIAMTETLALEWAPLGILVNVVGPGAIDTPMVSASGMPQEILDAFLSRVPLKRMGTPEEIAALVIFLASEESSYVTGSTFFADGGWLAG